MSKAKRGKSGSSSDVVNWEKELTYIPYNEEQWRAMVSFLLPQHHTDEDLINLIENAIGSGLRKSFSVIQYEDLLAEAKEISSHAKGGKGKPPVVGKPPQFPEICDLVKTILDKGEEVPKPVIARLIKFKLLMIKNKDLSRREEERKLSGTHSKAQIDGASPSKGGSSPRKSQSPSKGGKKGAKKEEKPLTPKKDTKLKKRGEDTEEFKTIDDEPDGENDPKHYIILTGFSDASLVSLLIDLKIPITSIICLKSIKRKERSVIQLENEEIDDNEMKVTDISKEKELEIFWRDFAVLSKYAPPNHLLHDVAKFDIILKEDCFPNEPLDILEHDKKVEFKNWLFEKVSDVCYDTLDYEEQYKIYMNNMNIIDVHENIERNSSAMSQQIVLESQSGSTVGEVACESSKQVVPADLRYYNKLMNYIPVDVQNVGLQLECLLEQVVALVDGPNPMDIQREARKDGLSHEIGDYLDKKFKLFGLQTNSEQSNNDQSESLKESPQIVYYGDKEKVCSMQAKENPFFKAENVFEKQMENHPYSTFVKYLNPKSNDWIKNCARRQQLYNICTEKYSMSVEKFERAMRQYIFESLPLDTGMEMQNCDNEVIAEHQLEKISSRWDDPYCDMQQISSQNVLKQSSKDNNNSITPPLTRKESGINEIENDADKEETETALRKLDNYNWLEHFQPNILFQILDAGAETRPYLDTYYNRGNNTLLAVLHNPSDDNLHNNYSWATWLHSNVGFRDYLEYVAIEIDDWIKEQVKINEEREKEKLLRQIPSPSPIPSVVKERSRWGMQTRAEINAENEANAPKENEKSKRSAKSRSRSGSPRKKSPDKKGKGRKTPSAKKSSRGGTATKRPISSKSTVSFKDDLIKSISKPHRFAFTGYNLAPLLPHIHGEQIYLFPIDGNLIRIEKLNYIEGLMTVQFSLYMNGDVFMLNMCNPVAHQEIDQNEEKLLPVSTDASLDSGPKKMEETGRISKCEPANNATITSPTGDVLPELPIIPDGICSYASLVVTFKDGLVISTSASEKNVNKTKHDGILESISLIGKETSDIIQQSTSAAPPKSPKGKRGKKEDESKVQSDALVKQNKDFLRKLAEREKEIINIYKSIEGKKNLYVTSPDGVHITFEHGLLLSHHDDEISDDNRTFVLKFEKFENDIKEFSLEDVGKVFERYRYVTSDGYVVKFLSDSTVEILSSKGEIFKTLPAKPKVVKTPKKEEVNPPIPPPATNTSAANRASTNSKRSSKLSKQDTEVEPEVEKVEEIIEDETEWHIVNLDGTQMMWKASGECTMLKRLIVSNATCFESGQVLQTREDGLIMVHYTDGKKIVEYLDGTRFTSGRIQNEIIDRETGEYQKEMSDIILVEYEGMASVLVDTNKQIITCSYGNGKRVQAFKDGRYIVSNCNKDLIVMDGQGNTLIQERDKHDAVMSLNESFTTDQPYCLLKQCESDCLKYVDHHGNMFTANHFGDHNVEKNQEHSVDLNVMKPRYFVIYPDGSGDELLRYDDVADYVNSAINDASTAIIRDKVEGDEDASAMSVIKPFKGKPSKIWPKNKECTNIIPTSLRERDFKTFPGALDKKNSVTNSSCNLKIAGTSMRGTFDGKQKHSKFVECFEIRHLIQYPELTNDVREHIIDGINRYGEFVQQQQDADDKLQVVDTRDQEEQEAAKKLQEKFYQTQGDSNSQETSTPEQVLHEKYIEAVEPPPPTPPIKAFPKRPQSEWEKDKIELAEMKYAKDLIRSKNFPPYFDTAEGQKFLADNNIYPDMKKLTDELAYETLHPLKPSPSMSTPTESTVISPPNIESSPVLVTSPPFDESCMSVRSSSLSIKFDSSSNTISPYFSSDGIHSGRPSNPTPKDLSSETTEDVSKLATIEEIGANTKTDNDKSVGELSFNESSLKTSYSELITKTNVLPNVKFSTIEEPVRRQVKTASIFGSVNSESTSKLRGFVLLPDFVDFGILREGLSYSYPVTMKNVGIDSCRFKIKNPPPSTGLKVVYKPGPVAAGMSVMFHVEIFAVAVGVEGTSGIGQISHQLEITTETEHLYLPVIATVITQHEFENPTMKTPNGGPSKGTLVLSQRPNSRDNLTRRKKDN